MPDTKKYTINISAQLQNFDKLDKELNKLKGNKELNINTKDVELLQSKLKSIYSLLSQKADEDGFIGTSQYNAISEQIEEIISNIEKYFQKAIAGSSKFRKEYETITDDIKEQQDLIKSYQAQYKDAKKGFIINKEDIRTKGIDYSNLTKGSKTRLFEQAAGGKEFKASNGALISNYSELEKIIAKGEELPKDVADLWERYNDEVNKAVNNANEKVKELLELEQKADEKIKELKQKQKALNEKVVADSGLSDGTKEELQAVTDLTTAIDTDVTEARNKEKKATIDAIEAQKQQNKERELAIKQAKAFAEGNNNLSASQNKATTSFGRAVQNVVSYGTALRLTKKIYSELIKTIKEMDSALTGMTVVTDLTREQAWNLTNTLQELATATGMTTTEIARMTTMYLQQGKTLTDAIQLTEAAAKAARIAGISGSESINLLTNAMNGFQISASKAMEVSDKFAALAASSATNYEELATALSKVAAQANLAGMSMDFTLGLLAKGIEVTREAPETIGTALKTVISRMRELTDYGSTLEDGVDVNRVDKALKNIGVSLLDANNEFRDLDVVLTEIGLKWDSLNKNQQANVAVALAGTRQQSRLIAMMQDFGRTQQLVNISLNSAGATEAQHAKYMQGLEAATSQLTTAYQKLITTISNSDFAINALNALTEAINYLTENSDIIKGIISMIAGAAVITSLSKLKGIFEGIVDKFSGFGFNGVIDQVYDEFKRTQEISELKEEADKKDKEAKEKTIKAAENLKKAEGNLKKAIEEKTKAQKEYDRILTTIYKKEEALIKLKDNEKKLENISKQEEDLNKTNQDLKAYLEKDSDKFNDEQKQFIQEQIKKNEKELIELGKQKNEINKENTKLQETINNITKEQTEATNKLKEAKDEEANATEAQKKANEENLEAQKESNKLLEEAAELNILLV